jgi:hypothetical protein
MALTSVSPLAIPLVHVTSPYMTAVPFGVSGFQMPKRICPQDSRSSESRFPEMASLSLVVASWPHNFEELSTLSIWVSDFAFPKCACFLSSGFAKRPNPEMPMDSPLSGFFRRPRFLPRVPSRWTVHIHFTISRNQMPKCPGILSLLIPKVRTPKCRWLPISTTCPN